MKVENRQLFVLGWFERSPWTVLLAGALLALLVAVSLMRGLMKADFQELSALASTLTATSVLSLGMGYFLYRRGWTRSPSLMLTLIATYGWAMVLTLFNVWVMAEQMFVNEHDLVLSGVLLLFAAIIATTFGVFAAASLTDGLRQLNRTAQAIASGDLEMRVRVHGRDEVAQLSQSFNNMAAQLQAAEKQRHEVEKLRRDLVAWTSHDLRTPLTSIRAMVEALHDGLVSDPETAQRYYRTIRNDVVALNNLIDDLFELAQLDAGGLVLEKSPYALGDLVSDALERFHALAAQKGIALHGEISPEVGLIRLNAPKIGRVLSNLIGNALRYVPAGGDVWVTAVPVAEGVQITARDNGPGFAPADLPRIFEQFYRGEEARSRKTGGAGLGLAIARAIVEAHDGQITAKNGANGGAVIQFTLSNS